MGWIFKYCFERFVERQSFGKGLEYSLQNSDGFYKKPTLAAVKRIHRRYRFPLQPTGEQAVLLGKHFGCVRWVYHHFLNERIVQYQEQSRSDHYHAQAASLTTLKKQPGTIWLREGNSQCLQAALRNLETAFVNFFRGRANFPRFKTKKGKNRFTVPQFVSLEEGRLYLPKFGDGIKLKRHRVLEGVVKQGTISKAPTGKYFVSLLCEVEYHPKGASGKSCGVDLGIKDFAVTSDGTRFQNHRHLKRYERPLAGAQKHLSRKKKGSKNRNKQRLKVAALHEKIAATRVDLLHKVSTQIVNAYDIICLEDLNVKGMMANPKLAKPIGDAGWGTFVRLLQYKAEWNDKRVVKINRFYPSSKTCHGCGWVHRDLKLSERQWTCPNGHTLDRDVNAAKNILSEGLKILSQGTGDYTCGGSTKTSSRKHQPVKQEADGSLADG